MVMLKSKKKADIKIMFNVLKLVTDIIMKIHICVHTVYLHYIVKTCKLL